MDMKDFFNKASKLFKKDAFIINNRYMSCGEESDNVSQTFIFAELDNDTREALSEHFDVTKRYYVPDVKIAASVPYSIHEVTDNSSKKDYLDNIRFNIAETTDNILKHQNDFHSLFVGPITDDQFNDIFENNSLEPFKVSETDKVYLGKELFPLITKTNAKKIDFFSYIDEKSDLNAIDVVYSVKYFKITITIHYINL